MYTNYKYPLLAANINRIYEWMETCDTGTISAQRKYSDYLFITYSSEQIAEMTASSLDMFKMSRHENALRHRELKQLVHQSGYGYIDILGRYKEDGTDEIKLENSLFVFDHAKKGNLKKFLLRAGFLFSQDSIAYADKPLEFSLYQTTPFTGIPHKLRSSPSGKRLALSNGIIRRLKEHFSEDDVISIIKRVGFQFDHFQPIQIGNEVY